MRVVNKSAGKSITICLLVSLAVKQMRSIYLAKSVFRTFANSERPDQTAHPRSDCIFQIGLHIPDQTENQHYQALRGLVCNLHVRNIFFFFSIHFLLHVVAKQLKTFVDQRLHFLTVIDM